VDDERCRITVVGRRRRVDLAVPARAPIAEYVPTLTRMCGQETDETFPAAWSLALPGARPLPPSVSLVDAQVTDGATLYLRDVVEGETDEPLITDIEELVEEARGGWDRWNTRHRAYTVIGIGLAMVVVAIAVLTLGSPDAPVAGLVAIIGGFGSALLAGSAARRGWPVPVPLQLTVALAACPLLALAGYSLPVVRTGSGAAVIAAAVGATVGALAAVLAVLDASTLLVLLLTAVALPVTLLLVLVRATPVESAAVVGVVTLILLSAAPTAAGRLVALAPSRGGSNAPPDPAAEIAAIMNRGRGVLITLALVSSLIGALCLLVLGNSTDPFAIALALCLSLALLAQAGQSDVPVAVMPALVAGAAGLVVLAMRVPVHVFHQEAAAAALMTFVLGAGVLGIGLAMASMRSTNIAEERPSWFGTVGVTLLAFSAPLAVGVFGVFQHLAHLGGRL
jgi:type VII secretion integral membrane protein EccD